RGRRDRLRQPGLTPEVGVADVGPVQGGLELVLVPLAPPGVDEHLVQPAGQGVADAEELAAGVGGAVRVAVAAPGRGGAGRAEHALELGLLGAQVRALPGRQTVPELESVEQNLVHLIGQIVAHEPTPGWPPSMLPPVRGAQDGITGFSGPNLYIAIPDGFRKRDANWPA